MLWIKSFHIIFVASWFAGLFYLPRIFVNLAMLDSQAESAVFARLILMARKLYRFMGLLALPALGLGLWLWLGFGFTGGWLHAKLLLVLTALLYHGYCGVLLRRFESLATSNGGASGSITANQTSKIRNGRNSPPLRSHIWFRWFNEVPVLLLAAIVVLAVVKPF